MNKFHDHLDVCEQCTEQPFNLCPEGARTLLSLDAEQLNKTLQTALVQRFQQRLDSDFDWIVENWEGIKASVPDFSVECDEEQQTRREVFRTWTQEHQWKKLRESINHLLHGP